MKIGDQDVVEEAVPLAADIFKIYVPNTCNEESRGLQFTRGAYCMRCKFRTLGHALQ